MISWRLADNPDVIHALVTDSDHAAGQRSGTPAPTRHRSSTEFLVAGGHVWLGSHDDRPVVTITVGPIAPFDPQRTTFPVAYRPWYMQRLAVGPDCPDPLAGFTAARHAIAVAAASGADALRAQANPRLPAYAMLLLLGFVRYDGGDTGDLAAHLQRLL